MDSLAPNYEGKGAVAGRICSDERRNGRQVVNVRVGGPNAGHTVIGRCPADCVDRVQEAAGETVTHEEDGHPWRLRQTPVAAVTDVTATLVIAAGSEVDPDVLAAEVRALDGAGYNVSNRLIVDASATWLQPQHIEWERQRGLADRIGSTAKGIGAARVDRLWRVAGTWSDWASRDDARLGLQDVRVAYNTGDMLAEALRQDNVTVVIEGTQGYGLGLHTDNYPQVTSGDCRAVDFMAQAGVSPWQADGDGWGLDVKVVVAVRPHPIRVAGNSGSLRGETTWAELGLPEERTTVTNKIRRVGEWDPGLVKDSIRANGGPRAGVVWVALTMLDSVEPELAGADRCVDGWQPHTLPKSAADLLADLNLNNLHLGCVGTGPHTAIVNTRMYE